MKRYLIIAVIALCVLVGFLGSALKSLRLENRRLTSNVEALSSEASSLRDRLGNEVSRSQALEFSKREFEKLCADQANTISNLRLKVSRLESITSTVIHVTDTIRIRAETSVLNDSVGKAIFNYKDNFLTLAGSMQLYKSSAPSQVQVSYTLVDSLDVVIYREPRKFLFIRYGTKRYDCYVRSLNPKSRVVLNRCTILKKPRS